MLMYRCFRCILDGSHDLHQTIEGIETLVDLKELYVGKNKITRITGLENLTRLTLLSIQVNLCLLGFSKHVLSMVFGGAEKFRHKNLLSVML